MEEIANLKDQINKVISQQRNLIAFFKATKEKLTTLEIKSSALMNENQKLKIRAASAWEELTPRPDLSRVIQILGIDPAVYKGIGSKQLACELIDLISKIRPHNISSRSFSPVIKRRSSQMLPNKRPSKPFLNRSSHSRENIEISILPTKEEFKRSDFFLKKKNTLPIDYDMVNKESNQGDMVNRQTQKSIIGNKRLLLQGFEKNDDENKQRSCSPRKN